MYKPERFNSQEYRCVIAPDVSEKTCIIPQSGRDLISKAGIGRYPMEACGILIGQMTERAWIIEEAREIPNINRDRATDRYQLDPDAFREIDRELRVSKRDIIGIFHSHPDCPAQPSPTDLANAWTEYAYIIISICKGSMVDLFCWELNQKGNKFKQVHLQEPAP